MDEQTLPKDHAPEPVSGGSNTEPSPDTEPETQRGEAGGEHIPEPL